MPPLACFDDLVYKHFGFLNFIRNTSRIISTALLFADEIPPKNFSSHVQLNFSEVSQILFTWKNASLQQGKKCSTNIYCLHTLLFPKKNTLWPCDYAPPFFTKIIWFRIFYSTAEGANFFPWPLLVKRIITRFSSNYSDIIFDVKFSILGALQQAFLVTLIFLVNQENNDAFVPVRIFCNENLVTVSVGIVERTSALIAMFKVKKQTNLPARTPLDVFLSMRVEVALRFCRTHLNISVAREISIDP